MDWSTDDMVRKLCQEPLLLPQTLDLAALAEASRKHRITGVLLLCDIDDKVLRKDFNIDNIGRGLRSQSEFVIKYRQGSK
jgi:hypothetical protein